MKRKLRLKLAFWLGGVAAFGLLFYGMAQAGMLNSWHLKFSNFLYRQAKNEASDQIVIVAIDNKSLAAKNASEIKTLLFSKSDYAEVIDRLEKAGAVAIGVDIILTQNSSASDKAVLVDALRRYDNVILAAEPKTAKGVGLRPLPEFIAPHPENLGSILFEPDSDNLIRRQAMVLEDPQLPWSFVVQLARKALGLNPEDSSRDASGLSLMPFAVRVDGDRLPPIKIPLDPQGRMMLNFFGPPGSFSAISFVDAQEGRFVDRSSGSLIDLRGKIVLIGEMGTGLHDEQYVPTSSGIPMPGVEMHANALQTLLSQRFLVDQSPAGVWVVSEVLGALALGLFLFLGILSSVAVFLVAVVAYAVATWVAFEYGLVLNSVYPYLALLLAFVATYLFRYFTEARQAKHTERAFSKYVSHHVVKRILEHPEHLRLGGEKKELTVLFSDIAGFTTISEKVEPEKLVEQLNEYLDAMTGIILDADGTLDKYIGDAIMAFWGAPIYLANHAVRACHAALDYQARLIELRKEWTARGQLPFDARIGINTGPMIVGNVGSHRRFDYTVIGDSVNLGARLEGVNKVFDTHILISETTYHEAKDHIEAREIDLLKVKGKTKPVHVYELQAKKDGLSDLQRSVNRHFHEGLMEYRRQAWDKAVASFEKVLEMSPEDGPSKTYIERCAVLKKEKLPRDWDGSYEMKTK